MATVNVTASTNIRAQNYTANADILTIVNTANAFVRLTIDADDPATSTVHNAGGWTDAQVIENKKIQGLNCTSKAGEIFFRNSSTTVPLIVELNGLGRSILISSLISKFRVEGGWLSLGTGDGTTGQTRSMAAYPSVTGKTIDHPPFIQVELAPGAGDLVSVAPAVGATYTNNGVTYTVTGTNIVDGIGEVFCTGVGDPSIVGVLTKASGVGDATLGFLVAHKQGLGWRFVVGEAYITLINIKGPYNNKFGTPFTKFMTLSSYPNEPVIGNVFEFDEFNGIAKFGTTAGGWVPPNGSKIRMPNIHFTTDVAASATLVNNRAALESGSGGFGCYSMSRCSFSDRFYMGNVTGYLANLTIRDAGFAYAYTINTAQGTTDINGLYAAFDPWVAAANGVSVGNSLGPTYIDNVVAIGTAVTSSSAFALSGAKDLRKLGRVVASTPFTNVNYMIGLAIESVNIPDTDSVDVGPFYTFCAISRFYLSRNMRLRGMFLAGRLATTGTPLPAMAGLNFSSSSGIIAQYIRRIPADEKVRPITGPVFAGDVGCSNITVHDVVHDAVILAGQPYASTKDVSLSVTAPDIIARATGSFIADGFAVGHGVALANNFNANNAGRIGKITALSATSMTIDNANLTTETAGTKRVETFVGSATFGMSSRAWVANVVLNGVSGNLMSYAYLNQYPSRVSNLLSNSVAPHNAGGYVWGGAMHEHCSYGGTTQGRTSSLHTPDILPFQVNRIADYKTRGKLDFVPGGRELLVDLYQTSNVLDVDFAPSSASVLIANNNLDIVYLTRFPIRGIPSNGFQSAAAPVYLGTSPTTGVNYSFRLCKWGDDITGLGWTSLTSPNLHTALSGLSGYDANVGFNIQYRIQTVSAVAARALQGISIGGATGSDHVVLNDFVPTEVGFIQVGYFGAIAGAAVGLIDTLASPALRNYMLAGGPDVFKFEYPYDFDGRAASFTLKARKAGYSEVVSAATCWQAGTSLPISQIQQETIDTNSNDLVIVGDTSVSLPSPQTFKQLYDKAQYWSCQRANMLFSIPIVSSGGGAFAANVDVVVTGHSLSGSGSLAMGAHLLTSDDLFDYTYTGGTFSQPSTIPAFAGGTLTLLTAILSSPGFTMATGAIVFDAVSDDWDLSTCTIGAGVTLSNTSGAAITVSMPSGYPAGVIGSGVTQITVVAAVNTLTIAANVTLVGAEVRVYDHDNTPAGSYGTELGGEESCPGATFSIPLSAANNVIIQIIKPGYVEFVQEYTMGGTATFTAVLEVDTYS